jgi:hypothetical protein
MWLYICYILFNAFIDLVGDMMDFLVRFGSVATLFSDALSSAKRYLLFEVIIGRKFLDSLGALWGYCLLSSLGILQEMQLAWGLAYSYTIFSWLHLGSVWLHDGPFSSLLFKKDSS